MVITVVWWWLMVVWRWLRVVWWWFRVVWWWLCGGLVVVESSLMVV